MYLVIPLKAQVVGKLLFQAEIVTGIIDLRNKVGQPAILPAAPLMRYECPLIFGDHF